MEDRISLNPTQQSAILELASLIAKKSNGHAEAKKDIYIVPREDKFTRQITETLSHQQDSGDLEKAIETILHCIYKDMHRSFEDAQKEMNCDDEPLLSYHIFNEVDFVAKTMFPHVKFM
jgi:hypothetical protein